MLRIEVDKAWVNVSFFCALGSNDYVKISDVKYKGFELQLFYGLLRSQTSINFYFVKVK
jgi:hypothetical protein